MTLALVSNYRQAQILPEWVGERRVEPPPHPPAYQVNSPSPMCAISVKDPQPLPSKVHTKHPAVLFEGGSLWKTPHRVMVDGGNLLSPFRISLQNFVSVHCSCSPVTLFADRQRACFVKCVGISRLYLQKQGPVLLVDLFYCTLGSFYSCSLSLSC